MDVTTLAREGNAVNLVGAACLTVLIYDHILCLETEISKMWPAPWSLPKILYCINRYLVVAMLLFNCISAARNDLSSEVRSTFLKSTLYFDGNQTVVRELPTGSTLISLCIAHESLSCVFYLRWLVITITVSTAVVQGILVLRLWALYRNMGRWPLRIVYFFYFGGTATLIGLVIKDYVGEAVIINKDLSTLPGCYANTVPSIIAGFWVGPLIVESVLFILVVKYAWMLWINGLGMPRIFTQLARDSTVYFFVVFGLLLANFLMFELGPPFLSSLLVTPSTTAGCILASHMILNMRSILSDGLESDEEPDRDNADNIIANESTKMTIGPPSSSKLVGRSACIVQFTSVDIEANYDDELLTTPFREPRVSQEPPER